MVYIKMKPGLAHPASLTSFIPHRSFTGLLSASHTGPIRTTHQAYSATPVLQATRLFQISIRQNPPHHHTDLTSNTIPSERHFPHGSPSPKYIPFPCSSPIILYLISHYPILFLHYTYHSPKLPYLYVCLMFVSSTRM